MDKSLSLYDELEEENVKFYLWDIGQEAAVTIEINGRYGVFLDYRNIPTAAFENTLIAHEAGHIMTGSTHNLSSPFDLIKKHENRADKWAIKKLIPKDELDLAVKNGLREIWELAEHFNVTEDFMRKAVHWYKNGNLAVEQP